MSVAVNAVVAEVEVVVPVWLQVADVVESSTSVAVALVHVAPVLASAHAAVHDCVGVTLKNPASPISTNVGKVQTLGPLHVAVSPRASSTPAGHAAPHEPQLAAWLRSTHVPAHEPFGLAPLPQRRLIVMLLDA